MQDEDNKLEDRKRVLLVFAESEGEELNGKAEPQEDEAGNPQVLNLILRTLWQPHLHHTEVRWARGAGRGSVGPLRPAGLAVSVAGGYRDSVGDTVVCIAEVHRVLTLQPVRTHIAGEH